MWHTQSPSLTSPSLPRCHIGIREDPGNEVYSVLVWGRGRVGLTGGSGLVVSGEGPLPGTYVSALFEQLTNVRLLPT